ncbi:phage integrase N-terminal domain-containing protein [uncultured Pseudoteredinibacter sp.]|uniref:phage integrase N-terminal domain-containing protein n=1 Tax=uncultured Pseudoteredinibacter sp. TaxID=1641701 RepID=UPI0026365890|nr:phage integrase N-terminal domain-containing protein [uncultured Pseudoteredinibacter sp.]
MKTLNYQLKGLCTQNRDGSVSTQLNRSKILQSIADQLAVLGYRRMNVTSLKPKHVEALVDSYSKQDLSPGTVKNRMSALRWWASKVGKSNVVAKDNAHYGIESRVFVTNTSKSKDLDLEKLSKIQDPNLKISLQLQRAFGLRREEAIKFIPSYADQKTFIRLKSTWCKGGKAREIPIRTDEQREVLKKAHLIAEKGSLIPPQLMYVQQMRLYERETQKVGLSKLHGLRHRYAQIRYEELTGRKPPTCGGKTSKELTEQEKIDDQVARYAISQELGHEREQITAVYLGR